jgi:hypothetical protein
MVRNFFTLGDESGYETDKELVAVDVHKAKTLVIKKTVLSTREAGPKKQTQKSSLNVAVVGIFYNLL